MFASKLKFSNIRQIGSVIHNQFFPRKPLVVNSTQTGVRHFLWSPMWTVRHPCDSCRMAKVDIPPETDIECPIPPTKIKHDKEPMKEMPFSDVHGGTNFGTPYERVQPCAHEIPVDNYESQLQKILNKCGLTQLVNLIGWLTRKSPPPAPAQPMLSLPAPQGPPAPPPPAGVEVAILGANSMVGQYIALLLKQCPCIKKLRLYDSQPLKSPLDLCEVCSRPVYKVAQDLQHIDTSCQIEVFSAARNELETCLSSCEIILILEDIAANINLPLPQRFLQQAPLVKLYAEAIALENPKAFVICCATPVDCMVPLIAQTLMETNWYNKNKLMGSVAVSEMRANSLAANFLHLNPKYTSVDCVGGTEGPTLVPVFSRAVDHYDFSQKNAMVMTTTVRNMPWDVQRVDKCCVRSQECSEAHALAKLVVTVAHGLLCNTVPSVSGFVEADHSANITISRFCANKLQINGGGICKNFGLPPLNHLEEELMVTANIELERRFCMVMDFYNKCRCASACNYLQKTDNWFTPQFRSVDQFADCAYAAI